MLHLHSFTARKGCVILEMEVLIVPPVPLLGRGESNRAFSAESSTLLGEASETPQQGSRGVQTDVPEASLLPDLPTLLSTMGVQGMLDPTRDVVVSIQVRCDA